MAILTTLMKARRSITSMVPLMRDARVPFALKALTVGFGALIISPIDIFGDIPILGVLDDGLLLTLLCMWFVGRANRHVGPVTATASANVPMRRVN